MSLKAMQWFTIGGTSPHEEKYFGKHYSTFSKVGTYGQIGDYLLLM